MRESKSCVSLGPALTSNKRSDWLIYYFGPSLFIVLCDLFYLFYYFHLKLNFFHEQASFALWKLQLVGYKFRDLALFFSSKIYPFFVFLHNFQKQSVSVECVIYSTIWLSKSFIICIVAITEQSVLSWEELIQMLWATLRRLNPLRTQKKIVGP